MTPRFVFWRCEDCDLEYINKHCYGGGKYCALDSGHPKMSGQTIVMEDLRQMCIYDYSYVNQNNRKIFWDYLRKVHEECDSNINEDCSKFAHKEASIPWEKTQKCVADSFTSKNWTSAETNNTLIDNDITYWQTFGSGIFPSIVINNSTFRGQLETQAVMNAICAGFA